MALFSDIAINSHLTEYLTMKTFPFNRNLLKHFSWDIPMEKYSSEKEFLLNFARN